MADENVSQNWALSTKDIIMTVRAVKQFLDGEIAKCKDWKDYNRCTKNSTPIFDSES